MYVPPNAHPSAAAVFFVGVLLFFGFVGAGRYVLRLLKMRMGEPWESVLAATLGVLIASVLVQILCFAGLFSPITAGFAAYGWLALGIWQACTLILGVDLTRWRRVLLTPAGVIAFVSNLILLAIAVAPSSKIDELHYHMLLPRRVLEDGGLLFYRYPWEGAMLPQMHYPLSASFAHSLGLADAPNVTSWCFALLLQVLMASRVRMAGWPAGFSIALGAAVGMGANAMVLNETGGSHAMGHLASAALVIAAAPGTVGRRLFPLVGGERLAAVAILATGAASTKLTLLPLAAVCFLVAVANEWCLLRHRFPAVCGWCLRALLPMLVLYLPLMVFTGYHSGSPFAIVLPGLFGFGAFDPAEVRNIVELVAKFNGAGALDFVKNFAIAYPLTVWLGVAAVWVVRPRFPVAAYVASLTILQFGLIFGVIQNDLRFLGGYPFGVLAVAAAAIPATNFRPWMGIAAWIALLPSLALEGYYARPFAKVALGLEGREEFTGRFTAMRADFIALDAILPGEAALLVSGLRMNSVSAPRPVLYDLRDPTSGRKLYLLSVNDSRRIPAEIALDSKYELGPLVYENTEAILEVYRTPGLPPKRGMLRVYELRAQRGSD